MTLLDAPAPSDAGGGLGEPGAALRPAATPPAASTQVPHPAKSFTSDAIASTGLALFSVAVAAGFARVFAGWNFFDNLLVLVVVGHGVGLATRRLRLATWLSIPIVALVLFWTIGIMFYATTYSWGLPSGDTWTLFNAELDLVREQFQVAVAPVLDSGGWPVLAAIGMAFAVCLSDAFAFGALARAEALVPGGVLFVFIAALGADRLRVESSVALVAAGVVATVVLRAHHAPGGIAPFGRSTSRVVSQALATAVVVALLAGFVGQRLPGARAEPLFDTRGTGDGSGTELSALVDIRSRLTNQRDVELIVVTTNAKSYWRATTLPSFDGTTWGPADRDVAGADFGLVSSRPTDRIIRHKVSTPGLTGTMVPAAPDPTAAGPEGTVDYDHGTATLTATSELESEDSFVIESAAPLFEPAELAAATSLDPPDRIYLELPDDFPDVAERTAAEVTAGQTTTYDQAIALQNWFKSEFKYSLRVQQGHGNSAIEGFLRDRVGYCEQFAGTYAAMMRSLGIPARVAVGFTHGQSIGGGMYSVEGRNAHAWPEVWFDGLGWVLFEPTPGRGAPGTEQYTGFPEAQDTSTSETPTAETSDENAAGAPAPTTTIGTAAGGVGPTADDGPTPPAPADAASTPDGGDSGTASWLLFGLAIALAAPAVVRRVRRRAVGRTNDEKLRRLWERALNALRDVGVPISSSDTPTEIAYRAASSFPVVSRPIKSLAEALTEATYRPEGSAGFEIAGSYGSSRLRDGAHWTHQIERAVTESISTSTRVRRYFTRWQ